MNASNIDQMLFDGSNQSLAHCSSHDIMDQTLNRQMPADNMVRTESSNIMSPLLAKRHLPMARQNKASMSKQYPRQDPESEGLPTYPNTFNEAQRQKRTINIPASKQLRGPSRRTFFSSLPIPKPVDYFVPQ